MWQIKNQWLDLKINIFLFENKETRFKEYGVPELQFSHRLSCRLHPRRRMSLYRHRVFAVSPLNNR
jgi:hypothetical protein